MQATVSTPSRPSRSLWQSARSDSSHASPHDDADRSSSGGSSRSTCSVPGASNRCENCSSVSSTGDLNFCSVLTTLCGTSSRFVQVIVVPTGTDAVAGAKLKLSITTSWAAAVSRLGFERHVGDRDRVIDAVKRHAREPEHFAQPVVGHLHRARRRRRAWRRLREGGRHRRVKRDVAFDLLHHLMDVTVQDRHGTKPLQIRQRAFAVVRPPSPLGIHRPERDVREDDDGRAALESLDVLLEPFELFGRRACRGRPP